MNNLEYYDKVYNEAEQAYLDTPDEEKENIILCDTNTKLGWVRVTNQICIKKVDDEDDYEDEIGANSNKVNSYWLKEVSIMKKLKHPNIIEIIDYCNREKFYVTNTCQYDIVDFVEKVNPSSEIVNQICSESLLGLQYLHDNDIIHSDIKSNNIMVAKINDQYQAKIIDFDLAQDSKSVCLFTDICNTLYKPLEIYEFNGKYDHLIDIWSLGIVFLEMFLYIEGKQELMKKLDDRAKKFSKFLEKRSDTKNNNSRIYNNSFKTFTREFYQEMLLNLYHENNCVSALTNNYHKDILNCMIKLRNDRKSAKYILQKFYNIKAENVKQEYQIYPNLDEKSMQVIDKICIDSDFDLSEKKRIVDRCLKIYQLYKENSKQEIEYDYLYCLYLSCFTYQVYNELDDISYYTKNEDLKLKYMYQILDCIGNNIYI